MAEITFEDCLPTYGVLWEDLGGYVFYDVSALYAIYMDTLWEHYGLPMSHI
jgi:hypothetical protein